MIVFISWVLLLTVLMFWPVSNLIWTVSVRRKQKKLQAELSEDEIRAQKQRARFISVIICFVFSILYNLSQLGVPTDG
jgi:hypothetical protein